MSAGFSWYAILFFFSSLSVNLILQCGLGMAGITKADVNKLPFIKIGIGFVTVLFLWSFFTYILSPLGLGFFGYLLFFPATALVYSLLEYLLFSVILKNTPEREDTILFNDGLLGAALFICYNVSGSFGEAAVMVLGFSAGTLLTLLIVGEINRRSKMEAVPRFLSGSPLILISMGLLSLVFGSIAFILFRTLGS